MQVINPANGTVVAEIPADTADQVKKKIENLRGGQPAWAKLTVEERLGILLKFGKLVEEKIEELAVVLTQETGKPIQQSLNEIRGANNRLIHLKANAQKWLASEDMVTEGATKERISYEPLGVVANISAWNFPYNVGYNVFLYGLVAGNSVIYKPSEFASLTGLKFRELLWEAGVPKDVFDCVIGTGEVGQLLLDADLDGYFFTGSYPTGKYIAAQVAPKLVPVQLELGGKDPLYVMDDVTDLKQAAINAAEGAFYNNGQSCCAVERIYVHESVYDEFVNHFIEEVKSYKVGDPMDKSTFIGPLTRKAQVQVLKDQVKDALMKGAELKCGGFALEGDGYFFAPTVLTSVNHEMEVMKEESFGPIIGIQKVSDDEEALALMKDTSFGLTAAVFAADKNRALALLDQLSVGTVYWNCCDRVSPNVPWSGRKNSGLGSTLSYQGIRAFVQPKAYHLRD